MCQSTEVVMLIACKRDLHVEALFASLLPWKRTSYEVLTNRTEQSGLVFESYEPPGEGHVAAALDVFRIHSFPSTCSRNEFCIILYQSFWITCNYGWESLEGLAEHNTVHVQLRLGQLSLSRCLERIGVPEAEVLVLTGPVVQQRSSEGKPSPAFCLSCPWSETRTLWPSLPGACQRDESEASLHNECYYLSVSMCKCFCKCFCKCSV